MTSSEKNTLFYIGLFGVLAVVAWKLWPALRRAINSGSSGGTSVSGTGASSASPYYPDYENESAQQGNLLSQLLNALSGNSNSGGHGSASGGGAMPNSIGPGAYGATSPDLASALVNLITDGENASDQLAADSDYQVSQVTSGDQIASVPYQNFDVNELAEPMPTSDDTTDYSDVDTNNYDSGQIDDSGDDSGS